MRIGPIAIEFFSLCGAKAVQKYGIFYGLDLKSQDRLAHQLRCEIIFQSQASVRIDPAI